MLWSQNGAEVDLFSKWLNIFPEEKQSNVKIVCADLYTKSGIKLWPPI